MIRTLEHPKLSRERSRPASPALGLLTGLFARLHVEGVPYCQWKSNEHLDASMLGTTDLDLLVHRSAASRVGRIFGECAIKRFRVASFHQYPGIEDWVGFDGATGRLTHLHIHYQLTLGQRALKEYHLPWEGLVFRTRILDDEHRIYTADPHLELLLLLVRSALKLRLRDMVTRGELGAHFGEGSLRELRWLSARIDRGQLARVATPLIGERAASLILSMVDGGVPSKRQLRQLRRCIAPAVDSYRMYSPAQALWRKWLREVALRGWRLRLRLAGQPRRSSRTAPQGGLVIAVVGGTASDRSRIAHALVAWLSPETAVVPFVSSRARRGALAALLSGLRASFRALTADASSAHTRRRQAEWARRARSLGKIVIMESADADDPVNGVADCLLRLEGSSVPGAADPLVAARRPHVVELATGQSPEQQLLTAQRAIWECL